MTQPGIPQMPDIGKFIDRAQALEQKMRDAQGGLEKAVVTGRSADGTVTVLASGLGKIKGVQVNPAVYDRRDPASLQTAIMEAVQAAATSAGQLAEQKMGPIEITLH